MLASGDLKAHDEEKAILTLHDGDDSGSETRGSQIGYLDAVDEKLALEDEKYPSTSSLKPAGRLLKTTIRTGTRYAARLVAAATDTSPLLSESTRRHFRTIFNYPDPDFANKLSETSYLNGLRGLAALSVFQYHYTIGPIMELQNDSAWGKVEDGNVPVWYHLPFIRTIWNGPHTMISVLFGISGYVMTLRMLALIRQQHQDEKLLKSLSSAVLRRGMRLYLPLFASGFIGMTTLWLGWLPKPWCFTVDFKPTYLGEVGRWIDFQVRYLQPVKPPAVWPGRDGLNIYDGSIPWTIPLEYYAGMQTLLALLAMSYIRRYSFRLAILCTWIIFLSVRDDWVTAQFLAGLTLADYHLQKKTSSGPKRAPSPRPLRKILWYGLLIFSIYLAGLPRGMYENEKLRPRPFFDWLPLPAWLYKTHEADRIPQNIAATCMLISAAELPRIQRLLNSRPIQYLGRISFGLYLCHGILKAYFEQYAPTPRAWIGATRETPDLWFCAYLIWMIPTAAANFFLAGLFQRYIDEPTNKLSRNVEQWLIS